MALGAVHAPADYIEHQTILGIDRPDACRTRLRIESRFAEHRPDRRDGSFWRHPQRDQRFGIPPDFIAKLVRRRFTDWRLQPAQPQSKLDR